jgi:hypothetical protein
LGARVAGRRNTNRTYRGTKRDVAIRLDRRGRTLSSQPTKDINRYDYEVLRGRGIGRQELVVAFGTLAFGLAIPLAVAWQGGDGVAMACYGGGAGAALVAAILAALIPSRASRARRDLVNFLEDYFAEDEQ